MVAATDPVRMGVITSLARPGGNVTGVALEVSPDIVGKQVDWLKELLPRSTRLGLIVNPAMPGHEPFVRAVEAAASKLGLHVLKTLVQSAADVESALARIKQERAEMLLVLPDPVLYTLSQRIGDLAITNHLPVAYSFGELAQAGGVLAYGPSLTEQYHRAATFVDRILKGAKPGDLPVEQPTKFELVINLKTAKAFGLTIPPSLLLRADQVIE